jgi:sugar phosphate isomerase/epimerase
MRTDQLAVQLWTVRDQLAVDLPGTLQAVAAAGYRCVELAGLADVPTADLARALAAAELSPMAAHVGIEALRDDVGAVVGRLTALGCPRLVIPWLPEAERRERAGVQRFAAELGGYLPRLASDSIALGYHNHAFEFEPLDGTTVWDILLAELAPSIELEIDVYWASDGGRDPVAVIQAAGERVRLLHLKDRAPGGEPHDAAVGDGILAIPSIIEAGRAAGVEWYVVEQDEPADAIADIASSYRYLETRTRPTGGMP